MYHEWPVVGHCNMEMRYIAVKPTVGHVRGMSRDDPLMRIRLPDELKAKVKDLADENHRSMNAEIVARLERTIAEDDPRGGMRPGFGFIRKAKENATARAALPVHDAEKRISALETAVLGLIVELSELKEKGSG